MATSSAVADAERIFEHLDPDSTGSISATDLENVLPTLQSHLASANEEVTERINGKLDALIGDGDGLVTKAQFIELVTLIASIGQSDGGNGTTTAGPSTTSQRRPSGQGGGISRRRGGGGGGGGANGHMSSQKLKHLRAIFDEAAGGSTGKLGAERMGQLLKDDLSSGDHRYASIKRKGRRTRMSVKHSANVSRAVVRELKSGGSMGGGDSGNGRELSFEEFAKAFGDMIDDSGQSVELPKFVRAQLQAFHEEIARLNAKMEAEEATRKQLESRLEEQARAHQSVLDQAHGEAAELEAERDHLQTQLKRAGREMREQREEIERQCERVDELDEELIALHSKLAAKEQARASSATVESTMGGDVVISRLGEANDTLEGQLAQVTEELQETRAEFELEKRELLQTIEDLEAATAPLEELRKEVAGLRGENAILTDECEELRYQIDEAGRVESAKVLQAVAAEVAAARRADNVNRGGNHGNDDDDDTEALIAEQLERGGAEGTAVLVHVLRSTLKQPSESVDTEARMVEHEAALEAARTAARQAEATAEARAEEVNRLTALLSDRMVESAGLTARAEAAEDEAAALRSELKDSRARLDAALASTAAAGAAADGATTQLKQQLDSARASVTELEGRVDVLKETVRSKDADMLTLQRRVTAAEAATEKEKAAREAADVQVVEQASALTAARQAMEAAQADAARRAADMDRLRAVADAQNTTLGERQREAEERKAKMLELERELAALQADVTKRDNEIARLTSVVSEHDAQAALRAQRTLASIHTQTDNVTVRAPTSTTTLTTVREDDEDVKATCTDDEELPELPFIEGEDDVDDDGNDVDVELLLSELSDPPPVKRGPAPAPPPAPLANATPNHNPFSIAVDSSDSDNDNPDGDLYVPVDDTPVVAEPAPDHTCGHVAADGRTCVQQVPAARPFCRSHTCPNCVLHSKSSRDALCKACTAAAAVTKPPPPRTASLRRPKTTSAPPPPTVMSTVSTPPPRRQSLRKKKVSIADATVIPDGSNPTLQAPQDEEHMSVVKKNNFGRHKSVKWFKSSEEARGVGRDDTGSVWPWFHGVISRRKAEALLRDKPESTFLVRVSESRFGYVLSVRNGPNQPKPIAHYMIEQNAEHKYGLQAYDAAGTTWMRDPLCNQLDELIDYFSVHAMNIFCPPLEEPCPHVDSSDLRELFSTFQTGRPSLPGQVMEEDA
eukprot:m.41879 g.41879  ORF g.41879 m.41879 type:complete len:1200 (-) comp6190_c0_seq2:223-3822(-)